MISRIKALLAIIVFAPLVLPLSAQDTPVLVPRAMVLAHDFSASPALDAEARASLMNALTRAVSSWEPSLFLVQVDAGGQGLKEILASQEGFDPDLILLVSYTMPEKDLLKARGTLWEPQRNSRETIDLGEQYMDERYRSLDPVFFSALQEPLKPRLGPVPTAGSTIRILAPQGTRVWLDSKESNIGAEGFVEYPVASGSYVQVVAQLPGQFKAYESVFVEERPVGDVQTHQIALRPYENPVLLESGLAWLRYPVFHAWWPLETDRLFWGIGAQFYGFGIGSQSTDTKGMELWNDVHLLEPGAGVLWYPLDQWFELRPVLAAEGLVRIDLASPYVLDLLTPLVVQTRLGAEWAVSPSVRLSFDILSRLNLSFDSRLATSSSQVSVDTKNNSVSNSNDLPRIVWGPVVAELFVPLLGVRVQL